MVDNGLSRGVGWREAAATAAGFVLLSVVFCWPAAPSLEHVPFSAGDAFRSYFPTVLRSFHPVADQVAGAWDPTLLTGLPETHSLFGRYYPPTVLLFTLLPPVFAFGLNMILHHAWAGLGAYLLVRGNGLSRWAGALAGVVFAFGGFLVFHRGHVPLHQAAAWLPWILWCLERYRHTGQVRWVVFAGTCMAGPGLAGGLQIVAMGGVVWACYAIYFGGLVARGGWARGRILGGVLGAGVLGAAGSAPQLLPLWEVARWSSYRTFDSEFFCQGSLPGRYLAGLAGPWVFGGADWVAKPQGYYVTELGVFVGVLPICLALFGLVHRFRTVQPEPAWVRAKAPTVGRVDAACRDGLERPPVGFWLLLLVISLTLMLGKFAPLYPALAHVPVYNLFPFPARHVWIFGMAVAWLSAFGMEQLRRSAAAEWRRLWIGTAAGVAVLGAGCVWGILAERHWEGRPGLGYGWFWVPVASAIASLAVLGLAARSHGARMPWLLALVALAFFELRVNLASYDLRPTRARRWLADDQFPEVVQWLRQSDPAGPPPRVLACSAPRARRALEGSSAFGSAWGLSMLSTYSQSAPARLARLLHLNPWGQADFARLAAEERGLSAAGGRYLISRGPLRLAPLDLGPCVVREADCNWKIDGQTDDAAPHTGSNRRVGRSLLTKLALAAGQTFLLEGELVAAERLPDPEPARLFVRDRQAQALLVDLRFDAEEFSDGRIRFAALFTTRAEPSALRLAVEAASAPIEVVRLSIWQLRPDQVEPAQEAGPVATAQKCRGGTEHDYRLAARSEPDVHVYENRFARELIGLVPEVRGVESAAAAAAQAASPLGARARDRAYIRASDATWLSDTVRTRTFGPGQLTLQSYWPDEIECATTSSDETFLVATITRAVGWTAYIDNRRTPTMEVDGAWMGLVVPAGTHVVRLRYRPVLVWWGVACAAVVLGGAWALLLTVGFRRPRVPNPFHAHLNLPLSLAGQCGHEDREVHALP
jgi:hypothetical protein